MERLFEQILRSFTNNIGALDKAKLFTDFSLVISRLRERGRFESAQNLLTLARDIFGPEPVFDYLQSQIELRLGNMARGWSLMRARAKMNSLPEAIATLPEWNGLDPVESLLVWWPEGSGIGGEVMRLVFLPMLAKIAGFIGVLCDSRLHPCLNRSFPGMAVHTYNFADIQGQGYTHQIDLISIPAFFWPSIQGSLPPCFIADNERVLEITTRLGNTGRLKCGFSWFTPNPRSGPSRSIPGAIARRLLEQFPPDVDFVSLQHAYPDSGFYVLDLSRPFTCPVVPENDIEGLIATIAAMDIVITIDNSVAHLAGAVGVPTILLLSADHEMQWYGHRDKTPFYRNLIFFKQDKAGCWGEPLQAAYRCAMGMYHLKLQRGRR